MVLLTCFTVTSSATGETIKTITRNNQEEIIIAIFKGDQDFKSWKKLMLTKVCVFYLNDHN